jgi:peroxiredoxin
VTSWGTSLTAARAISAQGRVPGTLFLTALVAALVLVGCDRAPSRAGGGPAKDPFSQLDLLRATAPEPAPEFSVPDLTGRLLRLSGFRGQLVLLNFWATWCPPCRQEMPAMERLYQRYRDRGFTIVAVSLDTNTVAVAPFVAQYELTFPIGLDPTSAVGEAYRVRVLPKTILIDRGGQLVAVALGAREWDGPAAHALIEALLSRGRPTP